LELQAHSEEENKGHSEDGKYFNLRQIDGTCGIAIGGRYEQD